MTSKVEKISYRVNCAHNPKSRPSENLGWISWVQAWPGNSPFCFSVMCLCNSRNRCLSCMTIFRGVWSQNSTYPCALLNFHRSWCTILWEVFTPKMSQKHSLRERFPLGTSLCLCVQYTKYHFEICMRSKKCMFLKAVYWWMGDVVKCNSRDRKATRKNTNRMSCISLFREAVTYKLCCAGFPHTQNTPFAHLTFSTFLLIGSRKTAAKTFPQSKVGSFHVLLCKNHTAFWSPVNIQVPHKEFCKFVAKHSPSFTTADFDIILKWFILCFS